ncbi:MAG: putative Histidine kinase [Chitinophagaceae bacterium]|nr:putative Histidine kinase [Chitinophagaceae bacterium]
MDLRELNEKLALYESEKKALEQRVEELTDFFENASVPLHWVDNNGTIIWANQAELDSLGYTKEEYIGSPINAFHADNAIINDILTRLKNRETLIDYPARLTCKDGSIKHVLINSNILEKNGEFIHTRCFTRDITELKKEEQRKEKLLVSLEQSEARFRMAMEAIKLGTWDFNPGTGELIWSEECKKIYGLPPGVPIDFDLFVDHIHPEDKDYALKEIEKAMDPAGEGSYDITYRILHYGDRAECWIRAQGKVYFNSEKQVERFIGTVVDIHDSKIAEEKSAKLAAIVESSDDAIISKTLEGIITSWNESAERMFGYTADEIIGQSILKLIPEERQQEEPLILSRLKKGERVEHFETQRVTKYKKLLDISLTISPIKDSTGKIIGVSKIARDISDKKTEEMRKNDFIAMVSHELKTPLTSIKSYVQVLLAKAKKENDSFRIERLTRTDIQVKKMVTMIGDFLSLAKIEEGTIKLNKTLFNLKLLIDEIIFDGQFLTSIHTIEIKNCDVNVYADKDKIGQVLINLLSNAIKYSPSGGTVIIGCEKNNGKVKVNVSDEGVGINLKNHTRLFDRFYRVENEQVKTVSGFGVGLYLVSEILRYHDSEIEVESHEGQGSNFSFNLSIA